jgi:hypothetical protein
MDKIITLNSIKLNSITLNSITLNSITLNSIKHPDHYNRCEICNRARNLNECNICLELFCIKCENFKKTCRYCLLI